MNSQFNDPVSSTTSTSSINNGSNESSSISSKPPPKQTKISNLTKNLLSSSSSSTQQQTQQEQQQIQTPQQPPSYSPLVATASSHNNFIPTSNPNDYFSTSGQQHHTHQQQFNSFSNHNSYRSQSFTHQFANDSMNYIPSSHNTPTVISTSYSSNHSYTPSFHSTNNFIPQASQPQQFSSGSYKPNAIVSHAIPTTNISMDSANSNVSFGSTSFNNQFNPSSSITNQQQRFPHSFPTNSGFNSQTSSFQQQLQLNRLLSVSDRSMSATSTVNQTPTQPYELQGQPQQIQQSQFISTEPDHYMTYKEFFDGLSDKDANSDPNDPNQEHLNIVDYPVNDLILMLSCLLTKIIEANDKLHPNHFDNTIAIRQKLKEERRLKKLQKLKLQNQKSGNESGETYEKINVDSIEISDDEEDEMKNKYLANVLAFHGTNVPGISLHAYLARVLKYCPVTNEVFLSLLVYFDRIAKKANNLKKKDKDGNEEESSEQLFVMDSYNIHRLIISGITVSSKFFSDIFYKNLRYAKVGGLPLEELNYLELQFLLLLDFKLMISVEDLQNYGDLLLRFWKREQITNDLVNNSSNSNLNSNQQQQHVPQQY